MKKKGNNFNSKISLKSIKGMKLFEFLMLLTFLSLNIKAQNLTVTIKKENVPLGEILQEIKKQSGKNILYNNTIVDVYKNESIDLSDVTVEEALNECLKGKNLQYKIVDDIIIIEPKAIKIQKTDSDKLTQTIKGRVVDKESLIPLFGATIVIEGTDPVIGTVVNENGYYKIENVPLGRYNIAVSYVGYNPYIAREVSVNSGKEVVLNVYLKESVTELDEVQVKANSNNDHPINSMATISAKQLSMEEANRYAGTFDDPARLVSSYAGVAYNMGNNGIVIRGNAPKGLLWRMEGVQIPNPNHFADYISLGGGALTALSSQTMSNSDFYTGAFPVEYGNALSGVFDIKMRIGNPEKQEHTFQAGLVGIDFASEGPFVKGKPSSYLFNYRYSILGLLAPILPKEMGILTYQDLSFKLNFPTEKTGIFSLWGIGALDRQYREANKDSSLWVNSDLEKEYDTRLSMGAIGISNKKIIGNKTYIHTTFALTENSIHWSQKRYDSLLNLLPKRKFEDIRWKYTLTGFLNHKFSAKHTNRTGFILNRIMYNIDNKLADEYGEILKTYISEKDGSNLLQFYSQSKFNLNNNFVINCGFHSQYFTLSDKFTFEPRFGMNWDVLPGHQVSFAYGLHSQLETIHLYLVQQDIDGEKIFPNKNLDFNKSHHFILGYKYKISDNYVLKIEPYYQKLYDIPVIPNSYISTINLDDAFGFNDSLLNNGSGKNYGIDLTFERFLDKGYYYLITASLFNSKYTGGDEIERNTRYNKNYVINLLGGKEWLVGAKNNNIFGINIRFTYMGGDRIHPLNLPETFAQKDIIEDREHAYDDKLPNAPILSLSLSYRKNKSNYSGIWSFQMMNALAYKEFRGYEFNEELNKIEMEKDLILIPNISYKIEF
ncbi:MAG: carboxypeptidase-like regulatory domain-containing protein [Bacteroidales bacterium]|nr:carboxypeptidase-like regulatory domain-containing protein [Bacteroidales bacterium]